MRILKLKEAPLPTEVQVSGEPTANIVSRTLFSWCGHILRIGYTRPLEEQDMERLNDERLSGYTGDLLERNFYERVPASRRPRHLRPAGYIPSVHRSSTPSPTTTLHEHSDEAEIGEKKDASPSDTPTLPSPVTQSEKKKEKTKEEVEEEKKFKKKYPGNASGGKVLCEEDGKVYDQSLVWALSKTFFWPFWGSAVFLIISSVLQVTAPQVTKLLLTYLQESYVYHAATDAQRTVLTVPRSIGYGIGIGFAIFAMQQVASLSQNMYMFMGMTTGMGMRSALIADISRKSLRLSGGARVKHPNGNLITLVSSDASFLDWSAFLVHMVWIQPVIIVIGIILLCVNLGYSALVGVGVLALNTPLQTFFVKTMFKTRQGQLKIVDQRVRLLQEVLNGIRVIKLYAFESFFQNRIAELRSSELEQLKTIASTRAGMTATMSFVPIAAAILSFVTYSLSGHELTAPVIFASLQLFNVIRQPLVMLPMAFTVCSDALAGIQRMTKALLAEELEDELHVDLKATDAIRAHGDFKWEVSAAAAGVMAGKAAGPRGQDWGAKKAKKVQEAKYKKELKEAKKKGLPPPPAPSNEDEDDKDDKPPFELRGINVAIPRGSLTCIVGTVGSGKSSLLQALIGEMKKIRGDVVFGGTTAYVPQAPWVMNASVRDNIIFGRDTDADRFEEVIHACALESDLEILPSGLETEIGEKGINLSGGQKARVCLARAVYFGADIVLLDDPLSAVDAHVSKHIVDECIVNGPLAEKTRILVTHHLEVLPYADHIIMLDAGRIVEQGTYQDLVRNDLAFAKLISDFGSTNKEAEAIEEGEPAIEVEEKKERVKKDHTIGKAGDKLMQEEERNVGNVSWNVYKKYAQAMGSVAWAPFLFFIFALAQVCTVGNNIFLGFWAAESIPHFIERDYMLIYAAFGIAAGICSYVGTYTMYLRGIHASYRLFNEALVGVMRSRISWFDTTPIGRITSRMSKDITTLDNQLIMQLNQFLTLVFSVFGTIGLVLYTFPLLGVIFPPMAVLYYIFAAFYRASSREVKRIDSLLRSFVYTNYGEMLGGMASVRAYRQQAHFTEKTEHSLDLENRAYFLTIALQRWLGVRLDFLGNILILGIALFGVGFRNTVDPSKLGVVLTYSLSVTQVFSQLVSIFATVEQDMITAERVGHYADLPSEGATVTENDPPESWPSEGCIEFRDVRMRYREGLPEVLKTVSFKTGPGEKIGIVGRTGSGKSSLLQVLFRLVEASSGSIWIDGVDLSTIGLDTLRKRLAIIPQDALLYAGSLRDNLDPTSTLDDATLNSALRRAGLVAPEDASEDLRDRFAKFKLDATVSDDGSNFSAGERQLVALCRALVKNSRVLALDEATSSVDVETDAAVQKTIQKEFSSSSMITIAHRLATVVFYDRVLVMDAGQVAEFDTPLALFDKEDSIFRSMCDKASLSRDDIVKIRAGAVQP